MTAESEVLNQVLLGKIESEGFVDFMECMGAGSDVHDCCEKCGVGVLSSKSSS